ncbi:MAG: DUF4019 domain-containing protein [Thermodesulfobacteriota bacterium]
MKISKTIFVNFLFVAFFTTTLLTFADENETKKQALKSAESWLNLVDNGEYGKSWDNTSKLFQNAVPKATWEQQIKAVRPPFGKVISRKLESSTYATQLPGAPDGEYVVIQYKTVFENKAISVETITPMKDPDGKWKVSGYYIK